jgi:hypothetical protein
MRGGVRLTESVAAVPVDQGNPQRHPPARGLTEQVDGGERTACPTADDRDDGPPASGRIICGVHNCRIVYDDDRINRLPWGGSVIEVVTIDTPSLGDRAYLATDGVSALVIDPQRDIDRVLAVAAAR